MKRNLILSAAHNLGYKELAPFLQSLRATGCDAHVHLFLSQCGLNERKKIEALGVTTESINYLHFRRRRPLMLFWPFWKKLLAKRDLQGKRRIAEHVFFFVSLRHLLNLQYLLEHRGEFEKVILTDCRDVYFQRDPFAQPIEPGIHFYEEARTMRIGQNASNSRMVRTAFGDEVLDELASSVVSCAGVTIGDEESVIRYLETMVGLICELRKMTDTNDQGVHNFVVRRKLIPNAHIHDNYSHLVFTAGAEAAEAIRANDQDYIIRPDGEVYSVLHQHDRFSAITQRLLSKLGN